MSSKGASLIGSVRAQGCFGAMWLFLGGPCSADIHFARVLADFDFLVMRTCTKNMTLVKQVAVGGVGVGVGLATGVG